MIDERTKTDVRNIRRLLLLFMVALMLSGLTAVPLISLTGTLASWTGPFGGPLHTWAQFAADAVEHVGETYPMLFYGTDWLAFAHLVIALAFIGPMHDPVRNRWVVEWGLWCCALVIPVAFFWAPVRGIPFFWRCVDAVFGLLGAIPLFLVLRLARRMERFTMMAKAC